MILSTLKTSHVFVVNLSLYSHSIKKNIINKPLTLFVPRVGRSAQPYGNLPGV